MKSKTILEVQNLSLFYGSYQALHNISLVIPAGEVTALIGPSGCGKSSLLRCFNRMNDFILSSKITGSVLYNGLNIIDKDVDATEIRYRIGMLFQKPNPFPKTIFENVAFGLRVNGDSARLEDRVEHALIKAGLWVEVKDRLHKNALGLSGGQQQRLCIARSIILDPEVLLLDEPCSSLDPIATSKIEALIHQLCHDHTIVIVTHNMHQALRVSKYTAFMLNGHLVEYGLTKDIFSQPKKPKTADYVAGRFG